MDVDHRAIDFLHREAVKKTIGIAEVDSLTKNKRQPMQLVLIETGGEKVRHVSSSQQQSAAHVAAKCRACCHRKPERVRHVPTGNHLVC